MGAVVEGQFPEDAGRARRDGPLGALADELQPHSGGGAEIGQVLLDVVAAMEDGQP